MEKQHSQSSLNSAADEPLEDSVFKTVICPKCGKRMLVEVSHEPSNHRCPVCRLQFQATWLHGALNVNFEED